MITVKLVYRMGIRRGERVQIDGTPFIIGRRVDCDLHLEGDHVSRKHASITLDSNDVFIQDLGSRNGTFVNGRRLAEGEKCKCCHRDKIRFGKWKFRISARDAKTNEPIRSPKTDAATETSSKKLTDTLARELEALAAECGMDDSSGLMGSKPVPQPDANKETDHAELEQDTVGEELSTSNPAADVRINAKDEQLSESPEASIEEEGPQRLPDHLRPKGPADSQGAAQQALRRHFRW